jgi:3-oxoacyl-[acyl-carrier protein] reductase
MVIDLQGHVALVTGASLGLGAAIARTLAEAGAAVVVNYASSRDAAAAVVAGIAADGGRAIAHQADVRDAAAVQAMIARAERELGPVDIVVNNAGREEAVAAPFELTRDDYQQMLDLNLHAVVHTCRAASPAMRARGWGRIVNIASEAVSRPGPGFSAYAAGKGAMVALSRNLALELGPSGITVNVVAPGWIATPRADAAPPEDVARLIATTPLGYQGRPDHVAGAVLFYASPLADFVTGSYLPVSGGHDL